MVDGDDYGELYETVLIDLPIGRYFRLLLQQEENDLVIRSDQIADSMKDYRPEKIKILLKKIWLSELYDYTHKYLNGDSITILSDLLKFESDCQSLQVILNTLGSKKVTNQAVERQKYINNIGYLVPDRIRQLIDADSLLKVKEAVAPFTLYREMLEPIQDMKEGDDMP